MLSNKTAPSIKGDQIGNWKLGQTLGFGSTGKVQLAYNKVTERHAAIKIISKKIFEQQIDMNNTSTTTTSTPSKMGNNNTPDSLPYGIEREIIIMKLLNHPNVLRLYDVWETNKNLYMILEYAEKGELFNLLVERGPLPENEAIRFFRQIIIGISYCHALGIVHRDLKPENLLLDHKYNIKIADFGMAALETEDKLLETSCGSPHYAAPEIVSGIPYHGFASDVWSCGVILFALLTGRLPFDEEDGNIRNLLLKVQSGQFEMPDNDEISPEAQNLLSQILIVDPQKRITARDILKHPLLQKYPSIKDSKSIRNLPREDTYLHPLAETNSVVDETILQNLVVLWHGRDSDEIKAQLMERGANAEKTLYALLHRFKMDAEQELIKNEHIKKRQSITSPSKVNRSYSRQNSRSPEKKITTPQRRRNRTSMISVASSHKRPISSYNKLPRVNSGTSSINMLTPNSSTMNRNHNKRLSKISSYNNSNNNSPTPASRTKRMSKLPNDKASMILKNGVNVSPSKFNNSKRTSKRKSILPNLKRGSVTTKLIATYAKLSEHDEWETIEKETKRTSSDFATLIDEIFEHEKYEQIRKEKEELARKVQEAKRKKEREEEKKRQEEELRRRQEEELRRKNQTKQKENLQSNRQRAMEEEINNLKKELESMKMHEDSHPEHRSVSAPLAHDKENVKGKNSPKDFDINNILRQRNFSLQTRPVSKLDPGLFFEPESNNIPTYNTEVLRNKTNKIEDKIKTEKMILETIRRSRFLGSSFDINCELRTASEAIVSSVNRAEDDYMIERINNTELPKNAIATAPLKTNDGSNEVRKISDVSIPQFTRKSKHFGESQKRLSVLSLYSTNQSYKNLSSFIKEDIEEEEEKEADETSKQIELENNKFNFETNDDDDDDDEKKKTADKLFEVATSPDLSAPTKQLKLSLADRYTAKDNTLTIDTNSDDNKVNLPILPPLDSAHAGLGIYQDPSPTKETYVIDDDESTGGNNSNVTEDIINSYSGKIHDDEQTIAENLKEETIREAPKPPKSSKSTTKKKVQEPLKVSKQRDVAKKLPTEEPVEKPSKPIQPSQGPKSFFRRFSSGVTPKDNKKVPHLATNTIHTSVGPNQLYQGIFNLLKGWSSYGLKNVKGNSEARVITGKVSSNNILSLGSTLFEILITADGKNSKLELTKKSGSTKAIKRLYGEIENVLKKEGVIIA